ncbi:outer membrane transport energization protein TonB [Hephaestia caeni]|uniref:Outer membrane transport energization protein TonB n=1 Tax=Hephaestia caeni TaxID=645617 RepID=A0A397P9V7_9SPHN|nr:TonB-dependent receptor [Hephaestia caeni]RIA46330.1 outer membrane transport energization protein TonB [Hephaestia caeni]
MATQMFDPFEVERTNPVKAAMPWVLGGLLLAALVWFIYTQMTASGVGITVAAPSQQQVDLLPPPPPPPPPPPEPQEKPPEPTEQPQPTPAEAPVSPQPQQAAAVSINAPAQAGADAYNIASGTGGGIGKPGGSGTCLGNNCGPAGGGGMSAGLYGRYLKSALQERVQDDPRMSRLVFSADYSLTVTADGRVTGVRFQGARGGSDADMEKLTALLSQMRGLDPPPPSMVFPQNITVRGRKSSF